MIHINLLPVKEAQRAIGRRRQLSIAVLSIVVAVLMMLVPYLLQGRKLAAIEEETQQLQAEVAKLELQSKEVKDLDKKREDLQAKLRVIDQLKQKRVGPVRVLEDLGSATPEKLWLVDFTEVANSATITGMALDNQTIAEFMRRLQQSKYFFEVDLVETSQSDPPNLVRGASDPAASAPGFKKFIVKARLDYLGTGGKSMAAPGGASGDEKKSQP
jgi:type IV pilus assembly protein PilN